MSSTTEVPDYLPRTMSLIPNVARENQIIAIEFVNNLLAPSIPLHPPIPLLFPACMESIHESTVPTKLALSITLALVDMRNEFSDAHSSGLEAIDDARDDLAGPTTGKHIRRDICFKGCVGISLFGGDVHGEIISGCFGFRELVGLGGCNDGVGTESAGRKGVTVESATAMRINGENVHEPACLGDDGSMRMAFFLGGLKMEFLRIDGVQIGHEDLKGFILEIGSVEGHGRVKVEWARKKEIPVISNKTSDDVRFAIVFKLVRDNSWEDTEKRIETVDFFSPATMWGSLTFRKHE
jgi:hypothetical protein